MGGNLGVGCAENAENVRNGLGESGRGKVMVKEQAITIHYHTEHNDSRLTAGVRGINKQMAAR